ncbi:MAG: PEP-CTERM sorting domain-containing protein [Candidatus Acidiferrales bacterium]
MKKVTFAAIALVAFLFTFLCVAPPANADAVSVDLSGTLSSAAALGTMNFAVTSAGRTAETLTLDNVRPIDSSFLGFSFGANGSFAGDTAPSPFRMGMLDFWSSVSEWSSLGSHNDRTFHFGFLRRWSWTHGADPTLSPSPTPEPPALLLLGTGLLVIGIQMRRRSPVS